MKEQDLNQAIKKKHNLQINDEVEFEQFLSLRSYAK